MADRLWGLGATGIEEQDAGRDVALVAAFSTDAAAEAVAAEVGGDLVAIDDESWRHAWKEHAEPIEVGAHLRIVTAWWLRASSGDRWNVGMYPGLCFGKW